MQAPVPGHLPVPREPEAVVEEWDDAACLQRAVERLDFERREVRELECLRLCVTSSTGLTIVLVAALALFAMVPTFEPLVAVAMVGLLRGVITEGIDQEIQHHQQLARHRHRELAARIESTDWLLQA